MWSTVLSGILPQTDRFVLGVCVFFHMILGRYRPGMMGKKKKGNVFQKNEMLAQVGIILLKYHIKLVRLGGMDDKLQV